VIEDAIKTEVASLTEVDLILNGVRILSDINLKVDADEIVGLVGSNGAGKSSVANVLCGYYRVNAGRILLGGLDLTHSSVSKFAAVGIRRSFQSASYLRGLSICELVMLGAESTWRTSIASSYGLTHTSRRIERNVRREALELLDGIGLAGFSERKTEDCPYGVRKFADVARAFMGGKNALVILDEPTSGIAESQREVLSKMIRDLRESRAVGALLVVDHDIGFIRSLCTRVVVLEAGKVLAEGLCGDVFEDPRVLESFVGFKISGSR
jgi:ABC-type branched-subunit amino acid transport system ATPase component